MACKTQEELIKVLSASGIELPKWLRNTLSNNELSDEELDQVSGGRSEITEEKADMALQSDEPYTVYTAEKYSTSFAYYLSWGKYKIYQLEGDRRRAALSVWLGSDWEFRCTPEVWNKLMGRT